jgi:hypothetical protein
MLKLNLLVLVTLLTFTTVFSQSQGPSNGSSFATVPFTGSTRPWNNPGNAITSNGQRASTTNTGGAGTYSEYLQATGFGFSIPSGATVLGIVVAVQRDDAQNNTSDQAVRIVKGGVIGATDKSSGTNWPTTEAYQSYGSSTDLWGETWTPADINSSNFGFVISARKLAGGAQAERVNHIQITVHYSITLPVNISRFSASLTGESVTVNWASNSEKDLSHYDIERSANGIDFSSVGITKAQQQANEVSYSFTDNHPLKSNAYYRLRAVDLDGQFTYSGTVALSYKKTGKIQVYPNPLPRGQFLTISNTGGEDIIIRIYSPTGILLQSAGTNKNIIQLNPSANVNGQVFYTISTRSGNQIRSGRLTIL